MKRSLKNLVKRMMVGGFHTSQRLGFDLLPRHFYSEIPVIRDLRSTRHWREPYRLDAVPGGEDLDAQMDFVRGLVDEEIAARIAARDIYDEACRDSGEVGYGPTEAECLYALISKLRPPRVVQIGCGMTTALCRRAAEEAGYDLELVCIEPYPSDFLKRLASQGDIDLIEEQVQKLPIDFLDRVRPSDLFFVDSSHTLGPAGEVTRIITQMLPRLPKGALVHFHDIWFPYDYAPTILEKELFFWHETALLMAFLCFNRRFAVRASLSMLHYRRRSELQGVFPHYEPMESDEGVLQKPGHYPSAIYLEVTDD